MSTYEEDRSWSDQWIARIRWTIGPILGPLLLEPAPEHEDLKEATDLIVFRVADFRLAARMRKEKFAKQFPDEFTIRTKRPSGTKTELRKILEGFGDLLFYGFEYGKDIWPWTLVNLRWFRKQVNTSEKLQQYIGNRSNHKLNGDGTWFLPFKFNQFERNIVLFRSNHTPLIR
jgi:hypothetical protein